MFRPIELASWPRREHYLHYTQQARCTYSVVVSLDVTRFVKARREWDIPTYPAQIHALTQVVNELPSFRMDIRDGEVGVWDALHPSYTIFHPRTETFSSLWTEGQPDFPAFLSAYRSDMDRYGGDRAFSPKPGAPDNLFDISSVPWFSFTGFNLNLYTEGLYLRPIFTIGRYQEQGGSTMMPLAIQIHHAACDGYHIGVFVQRLQDRFNAPETWMRGTENQEESGGMDE